MTDPQAERDTPCTHEDERGSTVMRVRDDRWECVVCGMRFRLVAEPARQSVEQSVEQEP